MESIISSEIAAGFVAPFVFGAGAVRLFKTSLLGAGLEPTGAVKLFIISSCDGSNGKDCGALIFLKIKYPATNTTIIKTTSPASQIFFRLWKIAFILPVKAVSVVSIFLFLEAPAFNYFSRTII